MTLDSLKAQLNEIANQIAQKQNEKQGYLDIANDIKAVYDDMYQEKQMMRSYITSLKMFDNEKYDTFKGYNFEFVCDPRLKNLISQYSTVINNIDKNLDALNNERARYENKAYRCDGIIGQLRGALNSIAHQIQNWVN